MNKVYVRFDNEPVPTGQRAMGGSFTTQFQSKHKVPPNHRTACGEGLQTISYYKSYPMYLICNKSHCTKHSWVWFFQGESQLDIQQSFKIWDSVSFYIVVRKYLSIACAVISMLTLQQHKLRKSLVDVSRKNSPNLLSIFFTLLWLPLINEVFVPSFFSSFPSLLLLWPWRLEF
jgi:hypothetical protein